MCCQVREPSSHRRKLERAGDALNHAHSWKKLMEKIFTLRLFVCAKPGRYRYVLPQRALALARPAGAVSL